MIADENVFYLRFILLLLQGGTEALRKIIETALKKMQTTHDCFLSKEKCTLMTSKDLTKKQKEFLFPSSSSSPDIKAFDISLLSFIIKTCFKNKDLVANGQNAAQQIREIRNRYHAHVSAPVMTLATFTKEWAKLSNIIYTVANGMPDEDKEQLRFIVENVTDEQFDVKTLVEELKQIRNSSEFYGSIKKMLEESSERLKDIKTEQKNMATDVTVIKTDVKGIKTQQGNLARKVDQMCDAFYSEIPKLLEEILKIKVQFLNDGKPTDITNTTYGKIQAHADDQEPADEVEEHLLRASEKCLSKATDDENSTSEVKQTVHGFVNDIVKQNVEVTVVKKGSVVFEFKCPSLDVLIDLIDYFCSCRFQARLDDMAMALGHVFGKEIRLSGFLVLESLQDVIRKLQANPLTSKRKQPPMTEEPREVLSEHTDDNQVFQACIVGDSNVGGGIQDIAQETLVPKLLSLDPLNRIATEKDLQKLAEEVDSGWEMLARVLKFSQAEIEQIKEENRRTAEQIYLYQVFLVWSQKQADRATLRNLFCHIFEADLSVRWSREGVARALKLTEKQIISCATGIQSTTRDDSLAATVYDGRLIQLDKTEIETISEVCSGRQNLIGHGSFGACYHVKQEMVKRLGMDVAVKKVTGSHKSPLRKTIVSRILHPFIVPMLSTFKRDENTFYIVYPFFEKKDLHRVLRGCEKDPKSFNAVQRIRVCYQVASALKYLHTEVPEVRSAVLHQDVCSQNILLDACYNARLTDFGMAREQDDTTSTASARHTYSHPDIGKPGKSASIYWDYFAFGVVIREILTGLDSGGTGICFLKYMTEDLESPGSCCLSDVSEDQLYVGEVWPKNDPDVVKNLCKISTECLSVQADDSSSFDFAEIVGKLKKIIEKFESDVMERETTKKSESMKCDVCMFNKAAKSTHRRICYAGCTQPMQVCMSCEKNSFLNPLTCYTCGSALKREVGDDWGALLVAGPDNDEKYAKVFREDVETVKSVITSKAPMIMGIREQYIVEVFPGAEEIVPRILHALKEIGKEDITTLLIYVSCHGKKGKGQVREGIGQTKDVNNKGNEQSLETVQMNQAEQRNFEQSVKEGHEHHGQVEGKRFLNSDNGHENTECQDSEQKFLGKNEKRIKDDSGQEEYVEDFLLGLETLSLKRFENELAELSKVKTFIIVLDMCDAPRVHIRGKNVLQINSCAENQKSNAIAGGNTFTNFFIQGLKGISEEFSCFQEKKEGTCILCNKFLRNDSDFLSVESLFKYIKIHVEEKGYIEGDKENIQKPIMYVGSDEVNIAYTTSKPVRIDFQVEDMEPTKTVQVELQYFTDLDPLRKRLYEKCGRDETKHKISIMAKKYRGDEPEVKCDSLEKVMAAWINRKQLLVKFEQ